MPTYGEVNYLHQLRPQIDVSREIDETQLRDCARLIYFENIIQFRGCQEVCYAVCYA